MWPYLIPAGIGALSGGLAAAGQGKNPLEVGTAALIGGGLGAGLGIGGRMAGQAVAGLPFVAKFAPEAIKNNLGGAGSILAGSIPVGGVAAGLAGIPGAALGGAARGGAAAVNALRNRPSGELDETGNVPGVGQFGEYGGYGTTFDVLNPLGQIQGGLALQRQEADVQLENIKKYAPYLQKVSETAKKAEFERMMAAAGIRQNIATQAAMLQRSQQTAQQMGLGFAGQVGSALTSQYTYG